MTSSLSYSFSGKRILVTGGGRGIGEGIVRKLYNDGATVFVLDRDQTILEKLKNELPKIEIIPVDLLNWEATQAVISVITPLDHLVNNAGIFHGTSFLKITKDQIDEVLGVNFTGAICVTQAFVNGNIKCGKEEGTTIVNISSMTDRIAAWGGTAYNGSKAALTNLTKTMALELAELNIRVNCVCPTFVNTELLRNIDPELMLKGSEMMTRILLKDKIFEPCDIANAVLFLLSPHSCMITGTSILMDAGALSH